MTDEHAATSTATENDPFNGLEPTMEEFTFFREKGEVPDRFKPAEHAETASADTQESTESEATAESADGSETSTEGNQEKPPPPKGSAAYRIAQLKAAIEAEWEKDVPDVAKIATMDGTIERITGRSKRKPEVAPPQTAPVEQATQQSAQQRPPQTFDEWQATFKPSKWIEDYAQAHPEASYEDATFAMAVHTAKAERHFAQIEQQVQQQRQTLDQITNEARERYADFDEIRDSFLDKTFDRNNIPTIPIPVLSLINDSPRMADVMYVIGSDESELNKFVTMARTNPNDAIRYIARVESLIDEELSESEAATSGKAPERQRTQAPAPPSPVGGSSARAFDVNDESLSTDEWMRKRNAQLMKKTG